jgi:hypothetical protein
MSEDKIADAIAAADADPGQAPTTITVNINLERGRPGHIILPADITPGEILGVIAFLTGTVAPDLARTQAEAAQVEAASRLIVPARPRIVLPS